MVENLRISSKEVSAKRPFTVVSAATYDTETRIVSMQAEGPEEAKKLAKPIIGEDFRIVAVLEGEFKPQ